MAPLLPESDPMAEQSAAPNRDPRHAKAPYSRPTLQRFGSVREQTLTRATVGNMDGAPMNLRTG